MKKIIVVDLPKEHRDFDLYVNLKINRNAPVYRLVKHKELHLPTDKVWIEMLVEKMCIGQTGESSKTNPSAPYFRDVAKRYLKIIKWAIEQIERR